MTVLLDVVVPVFVLVGLGWLFAVTKVLSRETGDGLVAFVFTVAVPLLLARTLVLGPPLDGSVFRLWLAYFGTVALVWTAADLGIIHLFGRGRRAGVIAGVGAGFSNLVLMGIPLTQLAFGQRGLDVLFPHNRHPSADHGRHGDLPHGVRPARRRRGNEPRQRGRDGQGARDEPAAATRSSSASSSASGGACPACPSAACRRASPTCSAARPGR